MMRIAVVSLFPEMLGAITEYGVTARALKEGLAEVRCFNPREHATDVHGTVDGRPYGGGPGMVMLIQPLRDAISQAREWLGSDAKVIYMSPQGDRLDQQGVTGIFDERKDLILVAGRYEGIDERLIELEVDEEISIGDYVISGGELPAMVLIDALIRQIPGALGHEDSAEQDSFAQGGLLDCPHYTRPEVYEGKTVPEVLLSGNHQKIAEWRQAQSLDRTRQRRPDLLPNVEKD